MHCGKGTILAVILILFMSNTLCIGSDDDGDDDEIIDPVPQNPDDNGTVEEPPVEGPPQNVTFPHDDVRWFTVLDPVTGKEVWTSAWAVFNVTRGGNMNEHYLATTQSGWITNLGGDYPTWSEDGGLTWQDYRGITEPVDIAGEGAIIEAPDGDLLAMSWFPWTGDRFVAYHYDSGSDSWSSLDNRMNMVFYDRPWIVPVPGPIEVGFATFPWASIVMSNIWSDMVISVDGLVYTQLAEPSAATITSFDLDYDPGREFDFLTPHRKMDATPLPGGGLLIPRHFGENDAVLLPDLTWVSRSPIEGQPIPAEHLVIDSSGALHSVEESGNQLIYHQSLDGGRTWTAKTFEWEDGTIDEWDFQADGHHELAVLYIREDMGDHDEDVLFHIRDYRESQEADEITMIGLGDIDTVKGVNGGDDRFDFASLAILPSGAVVVAFCDSTDIDPLFAVELQAPYD